MMDTLGQPLLSLVGRLSSLGGSKYIESAGRKYFGTAGCVLCREVVLVCVHS